jgi:hypothetical protein
MTPSNKAIASMLRAAKKELSPKRNPYCGKCTYICNAVDRAAKKAGKIGIGKYITKEIIAVRLGGTIGKTLDGWLDEQGVPCEDRTTAAMQEYRHAWLDMLIKEFSAK